MLPKINRDSRAMKGVRGFVTTHGQTRSRTYHSWCNMRRRCNDTEHERYADYGGRGINVCPEWEVFENFFSDMGECPPGYSIERIDNSLGYCKSNCKWIPKPDQSKNRRGNLVFIIDGRSATVAEWCAELGVEYSRTMFRIKHGWPIDKALKTPPNGSEGFVDHSGREGSAFITLTVRGVTGTLKFLCRHFNRPYVTAKRRIRKGWDPEAALFTPPDPSKQRY